jgi:glycosyltransferase involved in cell wall biosynthesis
MIIGYDGSKLNWSHKTGTENYATILLQQLLELPTNHQYRVYTKKLLTDKYLAKTNVEQRVIPYRRLWTQAGLALEVGRHQPDVLFIPAHTMPIIHRPSLKCVVTIHDLGYEYLPQYHQWPGRLYLNRTTEFAAKHATHLIAVSEFTKQDLIGKLGVPADRITVVYESVDIAQNQRPSDTAMASVKDKYHLDKPYILFVGSIQPRKNLVRLIEAFAQLKDKYPDLQLVLAGGQGWLSDDIYAAPARLGVADRVKFLGYVSESDKPALYAAAEATALVSLFEGFGLPVLESMACGTPVIAANSSSLPEVVGQAGLQVNPTSVPAIADGLDRLLSQPQLKAKLVEAGYQQVKKFSWTQAARQTLEIFEKVVK